MLKVIRSNYRYWRDKPTRKYCAQLSTELFLYDWAREIKRALDAIPYKGE